MLEKRLKCDPPECEPPETAASTAKPAPPPAAQPVDDVAEADAEATMQQTRNVIAAYRDRLSAARAAAGPHSPSAPGPNQARRSPSAVMQAILESGIPGRAVPAG